MEEKILLGQDRQIVEIPRSLWEQHLAQIPLHSQARLNFMTEAHHRVRDFAVMELTRSGKPLPPERIAQELQLPLTRVADMLAELERHKTFLFRDAQGAVTWAYPVTVDPTPHRLCFSTGEQVYAA